jgi:hypothetical protein
MRGSVMLRGTVRLSVIAATVLTSALAWPALADTTGGPQNMDIAYGYNDGGSLYVEIDRDNLLGIVELYVHHSSATEITCDDASAGFIYEDFYGRAIPTGVVFGRRQSSASGAADVVGSLTVQNTCDGSVVETTESHVAALDLTGSKLTTTTSAKTTTKTPDGTTTVTTYKATEAVASGTVSFDGSPGAANGAIQHQETGVRTH